MCLGLTLLPVLLARFPLASLCPSLPSFATLPKRPVASSSPRRPGAPRRLGLGRQTDDVQRLVNSPRVRATVQTFGLVAVRSSSRSSSSSSSVGDGDGGRGRGNGRGILSSGPGCLRKPGGFLRHHVGGADRGRAAGVRGGLESAAAVVVVGSGRVVPGHSAHGLARFPPPVRRRHQAGLQGDGVDVLLVDLHGGGVRVAEPGRRGRGDPGGSDGGGGEGPVLAALLLQGPLHAAGQLLPAWTQN